MIDLNKPIQGKYVNVPMRVTWATEPAVEYFHTEASFERLFENVPEPPKPALKLDLTKPIRVKYLKEEREITVNPYGGYTAWDLGGTQRCARSLSAEEVDDLYENFVREVYKFEFSDGIASVRPGKDDSGGATILLGIKAETSNPAITFTKTMSKGKVKELRDNLTKWLESVG